MLQLETLAVARQRRWRDALTRLTKSFTEAGAAARRTFANVDSDTWARVSFQERTRREIVKRNRRG